MKGTLSLQRLKRAVAVAGVSALVVGGALLGTTQAHAAVGTLGQGTGLTLSPASGAAGSAATTTPTFSSAACPTGHNGSAVLVAIDPTTPAGTAPGATNGSQVTGVIAPANATFTGTWGQTLASLEGAAAGNNISAGVQFEVADECYSDAGATQNPVFGPSTFVTIAANGSFTANQTMTGPPQSVTVAMSASANPTAGLPVTLTATVTPAGATGTIQFENNGANINGPATISGGSASTSTTFATAGTYSLTAVYTATGNFTAGTNGSESLVVAPAPSNSGTIPLAVAVPSNGSFQLTVDTTDVVTLTASGLVATGATTPITVSDTRNTFPGWSVSGQDSAGFTGTGTAAGGSFSGNQLGWVPTSTGTLPQGVTLGGTVAPAAPGLGTTAATLASVHGGTIGNGYGTTSLGANLTLDIPPTAPAGPYTSGLTISAVTSF
jgi:hypothetical protein